MVEIANSRELRAWLETRPREDAVLIAARAALRVFPLLGPHRRKGAAERRAAIILPSLRAMAVASFAGNWPKQATEVRDAAANAAAANAAYAAANAAYAAAYATADAADAAATNAAATNAAATNADAAAYATADAADAALSSDATALENGQDHAALAATPLWGRNLESMSSLDQIGAINGTPVQILDTWHRLRDHLLDSDEGWEVWTDWYQDRLDGKPANQELELAKALIPDEIWKAGPATLNAEVKHQIAMHRIASINMDTQEVDAEASAGHSLEASEPYALSDFGYDHTSNAMAPRPLPNDPPPPEDPYRMRDQADHLSTLSDLAKGLERDFRQDKPQIPQALRRNLKDYSAEAGKAPEQVRPRMLMALAEKFQIALQDEDIRGGMNNFEIAGLEGLMREHLGLVAAYYDALSERLQNEIDKYEPPANVELEQLEQKSSEAADLIERIETNPLPSPPPGYVEEVRTELAELRDGRLRLGLITDEQLRAEGARQLARDNLQLISTASREIVRWTQVVIKDDRFVIPMSVYTALTFVRDALRIFGLLP